MTYVRQFALPFPEDAAYRPELFLRSSANGEALAWIGCPDTWPAGKLAVHGEEGAGKTHLLHVFARDHDGVVLPAAAVRLFMPLPETRSLAIDDADAVADPRALLHVLNAAGEQRMPTLLSGRTAPRHWHVNLPDLASRLRAMNVVTMHALDDDLLRVLLRRLLAERQLCLSDRLQNYILLRLPRTGRALHDAVARLDRLTLAAGGHVTQAMAAQTVGLASLPADRLASAGEDDLLGARLSA